MPDNFYSKRELESRILRVLPSTQVLKVLGAYDMAENLYTNKFRKNGDPHFFHISRVIRIVIDEIGIAEPDIIIASMLQDSLSMSGDVNLSVIDYNYGSYVSYLIGSLNDEYQKQKQREYKITSLKELGGPDGLLIRLAKSLDNLRFLDFDIMQTPISYLNSIIFRYFEIAATLSGNAVEYLLNEIKKESNKIIG